MALASVYQAIPVQASHQLQTGVLHPPNIRKNEALPIARLGVKRVSEKVAGEYKAENARSGKAKLAQNGGMVLRDRMNRWCGIPTAQAADTGIFKTHVEIYYSL